MLFVTASHPRNLRRSAVESLAARRYPRLPAWASLSICTSACGVALRPVNLGKWAARSGPALEPPGTVPGLARTGPGKIDRTMRRRWSCGRRPSIMSIHACVPLSHPRSRSLQHQHHRPQHRRLAARCHSCSSRRPPAHRPRPFAQHGLRPARLPPPAARYVFTCPPAPPPSPPLTGPPDPPDSITVDEFINSERHGRRPFATARDPYTCGLTGASHRAADVPRRVDCLARAIGRRLGLGPREGCEWDRVVGLYSLNTVGLIDARAAPCRLLTLRPDRLHPLHARRPPPLRRRHPRQRRLLGPGARAPAALVGRKGPLHLRPAARQRAQGGRRGRHPRGPRLPPAGPGGREPGPVRDHRRLGGRGRGPAARRAAEVAQGPGRQADGVPVLLQRNLWPAGTCSGGDACVRRPRRSSRAHRKPS